MLWRIGDFFLALSSVLMIGASLWLTIRTRAVQFRKIPMMFSLLFGKHQVGKQTICARKALFTAMSTTLGISTLVAPVIAIRLGGPGAVVGFIIASFLGAAVNYTEVTFALSYRKVGPHGIDGGPMQYLKDAISPFLAKWYAVFGGLLMLAWSSAQANQLGEMLSSPLLGHYAVPKWAVASFLSSIILLILMGGIKRIADISSKIVPTMFFLYIGASLWIIGANATQLPSIFATVISSCFHVKAFGSGVAIGGIFAAMRWGMMKGLQGTEAGIGTQTIPHSMAETSGAVDQGVLSMVSTYTAGLLLIISSLVALLTSTWLDPSLSLGVSMVAASYKMYFSYVGVAIIGVCTLLFGFGTVLGNSYNGSQCYLFLTERRYLKFYYVLTALVLVFGVLSKVEMLWSCIDYFMAPLVIPHVCALVYLSHKKSQVLQHTG